MSMDEVRDLENMPRLNLGFYKFNIADAMYIRDDEKDINMLLNVNTNTVMDINRVVKTTNETGIMDFNPNHKDSVLNDEDVEDNEGQEKDVKNKDNTLDLKDVKDLGGA